jgi:hypothetical protein
MLLVMPIYAPEHHSDFLHTFAREPMGVQARLAIAEVMKHPGSMPLREHDFASSSVPIGTFNVNEIALDS